MKPSRANIPFCRRYSRKHLCLDLRRCYIRGISSADTLQHTVWCYILSIFSGNIVCLRLSYSCVLMPFLAVFPVFMQFIIILFFMLFINRIISSGLLLSHRSSHHETSRLFLYIEPLCNQCCYKYLNVMVQLMITLQNHK